MSKEYNSYGEIYQAVDDAEAFFIEQFLKYWNDYLTIEYFAKDHGITTRQAERQIRIGKQLYDKQFNQNQTK